MISDNFSENEMGVFLRKRGYRTFKAPCRYLKSKDEDGWTEIAVSIRPADIKEMEKLQYQDDLERKYGTAIIFEMEFKKLIMGL